MHFQWWWLKRLMGHEHYGLVMEALIKSLSRTNPLIEDLLNKLYEAKHFSKLISMGIIRFECMKAMYPIWDLRPWASLYKSNDALCPYQGLSYIQLHDKWSIQTLFGKSVLVFFTPWCIFLIAEALNIRNCFTTSKRQSFFHLFTKIRKWHFWYLWSGPLENVASTKEVLVAYNKIVALQRKLWHLKENCSSEKSA